MATPVGGLAESIERPGIGLMTEAISAEAIARSIKAFFETGPDTFVENIRRAKANMTWPAFAATLLAGLTR